jgi:uncharacterized protein involved in exopolysaccharide biosynthesis
MLRADKTPSVSARLYNSLEILWRRRWLIIVPILTLGPLALLAGKYLPKTYVAHALMMLPETRADTPFTRDRASSGNMRERISGFRALLKSDRVLRDAMLDILGENVPETPRQQELWINSMSDNLSLDLVGTEFLEFRLKGTERLGLGKQLEAVTTRFLEGLLAPYNSGTTASATVLDKYRQRMVSAQKAYDEKAMVTPMGATRAGSRPDGANKTDTAKFALPNKSVLEILKEKSSAPGTDSVNLSEALDRARTRVATLEATRGADDAELRRAKSQLENLEQAWSANAQTTSSVSISVAPVLVGPIDRRGKSAAPEIQLSSQGDLLQLEATLLEAKRAYQGYLKRHTTSTNVAGGEIVSTSDRILIIDAPRDPQLPATSGIKFAMGGVLASVLLGLGLAAIAEMLDQRLRRPRQFENIAKLPIVAATASQAI